MQQVMPIQRSMQIQKWASPFNLLNAVVGCCHLEDFFAANLTGCFAEQTCDIFESASTRPRLGLWCPERRLGCSTNSLNGCVRLCSLLEDLVEESASASDCLWWLVGGFIGCVSFRRQKEAHEEWYREHEQSSHVCSPVPQFGLLAKVDQIFRIEWIFADFSWKCRVTAYHLRLPSFRNSQIGDWGHRILRSSRLGQYSIFCSWYLSWVNSSIFLGSADFRWPFTFAELLFYRFRQEELRIKIFHAFS